MECWEMIEDFSNYAVSDWGRVKRISPGRNTCKGKILKQQLSREGYLRIHLHKRGRLMGPPNLKRGRFG